MKQAAVAGSNDDDWTDVLRPNKDVCVLRNLRNCVLPSTAGRRRAKTGVMLVIIVGWIRGVERPGTSEDFRSKAA